MIDHNHMDTRALRYFVEVIRQKSFTKASEVLHLTQPTISKMVKNLEEELGVPLLDRNARHIKPTDAGEIVYVRGQEILQSMHNLRAELDDLAQLCRGVVKVGLPPMIGSAFFPQVLSDFHRRYPDIEIRIFEAGAKPTEAAVIDGTVDIGISVLPVNEEIFSTFPFASECLKAVVHPSHPFASRKEIKLAELKDEPIILFCEDFALHTRIRKECERAGFSPQVVSESSQWDFMAAMVEANLGVALLPLSICKRLNPEKTRVIPLREPAIPWELAVIWRQDHYLPYAARKWIAFTCNALQVTVEQPISAKTLIKQDA